MEQPSLLDDPSEHFFHGGRVGALPRLGNARGRAGAERQCNLSVAAREIHIIGRRTTRSAW
jgi:hypothetical protein